MSFARELISLALKTSFDRLFIANLCGTGRCVRLTAITSLRHARRVSVERAALAASDKWRMEVPIYLPKLQTLIPAAVQRE